MRVSVLFDNNGSLYDKLFICGLIIFAPVGLCTFEAETGDERGSRPLSKRGNDFFSVLYLLSVTQYIQFLFIEMCEVRMEYDPSGATSPFIKTC